MGWVTLSEYITHAKHRSFAWGEFDCISFADDAFQAMHGRGFAGDWREGYSSLSGAIRRFMDIRRSSPHNDIPSALDARLDRQDALRPDVGCLAFRKTDSAIGGIFGITLPVGVAFVSTEGFLIVPHSPEEAYWR
jgi:hypothetical protein